MVLFVRKLGKFMKKVIGGSGRRSSSKRKEERRCYDCGEVGHLVADCPSKNKSRKKEKGKSKDDKEDKSMSFNKKKGHAYFVECDFNASSSEYDDEKTPSKSLRHQSPLYLTISHRFTAIAWRLFTAVTTGTCAC
jgi:hypothetical protein